MSDSLICDWSEYVVVRDDDGVENGVENENIVADVFEDIDTEGDGDVGADKEGDIWWITAWSDQKRRFFYKWQIFGIPL